MLSFPLPHGPRFACRAVVAAVSMLCAHAMAADEAADAKAAAPAATATPATTTTTEPTARVEVHGARLADTRQLETAAKVFVLREDLLKFGDKTLSEALKRVPGITVDGEVRMRGLGAGYTQILIDGEPAPANFTIDSISPDLIERIEILRTAVAEYSARSIAGTINLILRKKVSADQRSVKLAVEYDEDRWLPSVSAQLSGGEGSLTYQVTANASQARPHMMARIYDEEYSPSGELTTHRTTTEEMLTRTTTLNITPRITWKTEVDTVSWQLFLQHATSPADWEQHETVNLGQPTEFPHSRWSNREYRTNAVRSDLTWNRRIGADDKLDAKLGLYRQKRDTNFHFLGYDNYENYLAERHEVDRNVVSDAIDSSAVTRGKYSTAIGEAHSLAAGWDGSLIRRSEKRQQYDWSGAGELTFTRDQRYTAHVRQLALFVQDEWNVSQQLQAYLGLRWEGLRTEVSGLAFNTVSNDSSVFSPILQMVWKLPERQGDQVRLGLSRTYKAPATANLVPRRYVINNNNGPTNSSTQGNPDLRPELAWGLDVAYESYFNKTGFLGASAYARHIDSVITPTLFQDGTEWVNSLTNNGSATAYGVELELKAPLRALSAGAPDATVRANVARNWSRVSNITGPNNRLSNQTPFSANLGFDYNASETLSLGSSFTYKSKVLAKVTDTWTTGTEAVRTLDAYGLWKASPRASLRLAVSNLLHQDQGDVDLYDSSTVDTARRIRTESSTKLRLTLEVKL